MTALEIVSHDVAETEQLGQALGALVQPGDVICLSGELGAGKTAFTRGIGAGWGAQQRVTSPTFTLIHEHHRRRSDATLFHVDCYRLRGPVDAWGIGLEDLFHGDDIVVVEWPEHIAEVLPDERLWLTLTDLGGTERRIEVTPRGARYETLLAAWRGALADV